MLLIFGGVYFYFSLGMAPVATAAQGMPFEKRLVEDGPSQAGRKRDAEEYADSAGREQHGRGRADLQGQLRGMPWTSEPKSDGNLQRHVPQTSAALPWPWSYR